MSDKKMNKDNLPDEEKKSEKPDVADISFKKTQFSENKGISLPEKDRQVLNLNNSSIEKKVHESEEKKAADLDKKALADLDRIFEKNMKFKPYASDKNENSDQEKKDVSDFDLKGISVDMATDNGKSEKTDPDKKDISFDRPEERLINDNTHSPVKNDDRSNKRVKNSSSRNRKKNKRKNQTSFNNSIFGGFFLAFGIIIAAFIVALGGITLGQEYLGINKSENDITFNIPQGSTSDDIADLLVENQIISHKMFFKLVLKLTAPATIYPGDITLQPSMGYSAIIEKLGIMRESYKTATISFPEGVTLLEAAKMLEENGVCTADDFLFEFNKNQGYDFEKQISGNDDAFYHMEGYFFPDTYEFYLNDTGYNITKIVREHFTQKFTDKMFEKMKASKLTLNQVMILASMVQWESGSVEDMPKVASVFLNRLKDPDTFPSFQSDATAKYIDEVIKEEADTTAELEHYTEGYDTYNYKGLPSGPICNPGMDAINAVLNPEKTDYYYFCNNLKTGESFFASTLEEHEVNLEKAGLT